MAKKQRDLFDELEGTTLREGVLVADDKVVAKLTPWDMTQKPVKIPHRLKKATNPFKDIPLKSNMANATVPDLIDPFKKSDRQVILGNIPSKSNCYRIITFRPKDPTKHPHASLAKTPELKKYEDSFYLQCSQYRNKNIQGFFELEVDVYYPNQRADLDNSLKVLLDCLQTINAYPNDNKCSRIVANKYLDKDNPRIEFSLKEAQIKDCF